MSGHALNVDPRGKGLDGSKEFDRREAGQASWPAPGSCKRRLGTRPGYASPRPAGRTLDWTRSAARGDSGRRAKTRLPQRCNSRARPRPRKTAASSADSWLLPIMDVPLGPLSAPIFIVLVAS